MQLARRFLVLQALMIWMGGFVFYAAIVVPIGTDVLGSFEQGSVTRRVTVWLNRLGVIALAMLAWDQLARASRSRWALWVGLLATLICLFWLHHEVEQQIDFGPEQHISDYSRFYAYHRAYLYVSAIQWFLGSVYTLRMLHDLGATGTGGQPINACSTVSMSSKPVEGGFGHNGVSLR